MFFHPISILLVSFISVFLTTTGWMKTAFERKLENNGITRIWYIPVFSLIILLLNSSVETSMIVSVFADKIDIILLVLSFSLLSEGMRESRIFKRSGELISEKSDNIYELILYISLITGLFTVFASNDIVIIALTPVIFNVVRQSKIENVKIILLSQFVIANTLSMATYIGSPTNIIVSQELGINFIEYLTYMIVPSLISFLSTIFVIFSFVIISKKFNFLNSFEIKSTLEDKNSIEVTEATNYIWIIIFLISVLCVALLTVYNVSLLWCAIPLSVVSVTLLRRKNGIPQNKRTPYGIFFFGICFFIIGEAFASTRIISSEAIPLIQSLVNSNVEISSVASILASGILVNIFNDLPASAIISPIISEIVFESASQRIVLTQSLLIGLNIGKYLTKIGSLAGIIWFKQIRYESEQEDYILPSSKDLFVFGVANFIFTGFTLSVYLYLEYTFILS